MVKIQLFILFMGLIQNIVMMHITKYKNFELQPHPQKMLK